jgi:hypothetical protein
MGRNWLASKVATQTVSPASGHKLYFVCSAALMDVNHRSNIACLQAFIGQVLGKHHAVVFVNQGRSSVG